MKIFYTTLFLLFSFFCEAQLTLNTQFINPCGGDEHNEFIVAKTGANPVNIADMAFGSYDPTNSINLVNYNYWWAGTNVAPNPYPTFSSSTPEVCGSSNPFLSCFGFRYPSVPADNTDINTLITELNTAAGCNVFLPVPATNIIPANSKIIVFLGAGYRNATALCGFDNVNTNLNFSSHCSGGNPLATYYAVFGTGSGAGANCTNTGGGYFSNSARRVSSLHVLTGGSNTNIANYSSSYQDYDPGIAPTSGNAGVMTPDGTGSVAWINNQGCIPAPEIIVPIKLEYFTGELKNSKGLLKWKNAFEENIRLFVIEKSINGRDFYPIINVDPKNISGSEYTITDNAISNGNNFYRIKVINRDGTIDNSSIIRITYLKGVPSNWFVYPSPAESAATLVFQSTTRKNISVKIIDVTGRLISDKFVAIVPGNNQINLNAEKLSKGTYFINVFDGDNKTTAPFLKK